MLTKCNVKDFLIWMLSNPLGIEVFDDLLSGLYIFLCSTNRYILYHFFIHLLSAKVRIFFYIMHHSDVKRVKRTRKRWLRADVRCQMEEG